MLNRVKRVFCLLTLLFSFLFGDATAAFAKDNRKAIICVTGIMASALRDGREFLWFKTTLPFLWNFSKNYKKLKFDDEGIPYNKDIFAPMPSLDSKNSSEKELVNFGVDGCDKKIVNMLNDRYGPGTVYNFDIVRFSYDWRKSCSEIAKGLLNLLEEYDEVYFIGYSMGGIIVSSLLSKIQKLESFMHKVKSCIFVAVPFYGSCDAWYTFEKGLNLRNDTFISYIKWLFAKFFRIDDATKDLSHNIPSVYELLPHEEYFNLELKDNKRLANNISAISSRSEMIKVLESKNWYKKENGENKNFLEKAEEFQLNLRNSIYPELVKSENCYFICGEGIPTASGLGYNDENQLVVTNVSNGDDTVVCKSAFPVGTEKFKIFTIGGVRHGKMLNSDSVLSIIFKILETDFNSKVGAFTL